MFKSQEPEPTAAPAAPLSPWKQREADILARKRRFIGAAEVMILERDEDRFCYLVDEVVSNYGEKYYVVLDSRSLEVVEWFALDHAVTEHEQDAEVLAVARGLAAADDLELAVAYLTETPSLLGAGYYGRERVKAINGLLTATRSHFVQLQRQGPLEKERSKLARRAAARLESTPPPPVMSPEEIEASWQATCRAQTETLHAAAKESEAFFARLEEERKAAEAEELRKTIEEEAARAARS